MTSAFHKQVGICTLLLFFVLSCTKEGLPGPAGEQGPPGEDAVGNGPGGPNKIISYYTPAGTSFAWEPATSGNYRLKYTTATHAGSTFTLPDSVTKYIDAGSLIVYAYQGNAQAQWWQELQVVPAYFNAIAAYTYTVEKITDTGYRLSFLTIGQPTVNYYQLRFVVIPKNESDVFGD